MQTLCAEASSKRRRERAPAEVGLINLPMHGISNFRDITTPPESKICSHQEEKVYA
jgi:hypothetical protein